VSTRLCLPALTLAVLVLGSAPLAARADKGAGRETLSFGTLRAPSSETARAQALAWLKSAGKSDAGAMKRFDAIWADSERSLTDRLADTFALGDAEAAGLLAVVRDPVRPAPTTVPAVLTDSRRPAYFRANLALAYGKALCRRRVYEEALGALKGIRPDQLVEPATYFFHRAVAEHALALKTEANRSIIGLLEDVADVPDRYRMVAALMYQDMVSWRQKDLGDIVRKMDNIERRLELARGGPQTQKIQKEVVARLDEIIKKLESSSESNQGACPNGGQQGNPSGGMPNAPMPDSKIATNGGPGNVDAKRLKVIAQQWGKLPEKERAQAMQDFIRGMPERHREVIENYFKKLAQSQPSQP
jgi:hypothetical protein